MNGQCYPRSFDLIEQLVLAAEKEVDPVERSKFVDISLVHGDVTPSSGIDEGKRIDHAWVEIGGYVLDDATGECAGLPIDVYYNNYSANPRVRYTYPMAKKLYFESQIYGPWDTDGREQRGLPPLDDSAAGDT